MNIKRIVLSVVIFVVGLTSVFLLMNLMLWAESAPEASLRGVKLLVLYGAICGLGICSYGLAATWIAPGSARESRQHERQGIHRG